MLLERPLAGPAGACRRRARRGGGGNLRAGPFHLVAAAAFALLALALPRGAARAASDLRLAPLGDSITQGDSTYQSYRYPLWMKLVDHGVPFDLVGSMDSNLWGNPEFPDYRGHVFDLDHEGHYGWETNEVLDGRPGDGRLLDWLMAYTPDIVLMHLGTNDVLHGQSLASTVTELEDVISLLQADNPDVTILLARLIPSTDPEGDAIPPLNAEMDGIAARLATPDSAVVVVDHFTGFDPATMLHDPWHPNAIGEERMASVWMEALAAGPMARPDLRWDADGLTLRWDPPVGTEGIRLYQGLVADLVDGDGNGQADGGYGECDAALAGPATSFQPSGSPAPGQILFSLIEVESLGRSWGLGRTSGGLPRTAASPCP